jgi:hypothetical protein
MYSFLLIPVAVFLIARGMYIFARGKSKIAKYFIITSVITSSLITIIFLTIGKAIPDLFFYFTMPFGLISSFLFTLSKEESVFINATAFF